MQESVLRNVMLYDNYFLRMNALILQFCTTVHAFYSWYVVYLTIGTDFVGFVLLDMIYFIVFLVSSTVKVLITKRYSNTITAMGFSWGEEELCFSSCACEGFLFFVHFLVFRLYFMHQKTTLSTNEKKILSRKEEKARPDQKRSHRSN